MTSIQSFCRDDPLRLPMAWAGRLFVKYDGTSPSMIYGRIVRGIIVVFLQPEVIVPLQRGNFDEYKLTYLL